MPVRPASDSIDTHQIQQVFSVLDPDMQLHPMSFDGPAFYGRLDEEFGDFNKHVLISCHSFDEAWTTWEMHPEGDECVILLSGKATMALLKDGEEHTTTLDTPGQYIVVPRGAWHKALEAENATMLFITPGQGTQNELEPPAR